MPNPKSDGHDPSGVPAAASPIEKVPDSTTGTVESSDTVEVLLDNMTAAEAQEIFDMIRGTLENLWELVVLAYVRRADKALNYPSWDACCRKEFGSFKLRLPVEERVGVVRFLRQAGMTVRPIASATGLSVGTVHAIVNCSDLNDEPLPMPDNVIGLDGRRRRAKNRKSKVYNRFVADFRKAAEDLDNAAKRLQAGLQDRKFTYHRDQLTNDVGAKVISVHEILTESLPMYTTRQGDLFAEDGVVE